MRPETRAVLLALMALLAAGVAAIIYRINPQSNASAAIQEVGVRC